ncbi:putative acyl-activating enzyme 19 isoform X1 [Senna tora]|uniref:Putative acyl-activating enzyme 19 isoform X1 n=1 Tax=Senna tora TaxID=362788 RepID=A0A834XG80_9FABA|nr:putative acyl-activating enzyme 19 isoform X1 [Senna tora]
MNEKSKRRETKTCCISHEFFRVASANPNKIAVIHASGVAQFSRELREKSTSSNFHRDIIELLDKRAESISPPVYAGDSCYTYSDLLKAVHSLSSRLRSILLGADDPYLIRPKAQGSTDVNRKEGSTVQTLNSSKILMPSGETKADPNKEYRPKIVGIYMPPSVEYIVAVLSVLRCGEAFLPLDPFWPKGRILSIISSSKADLIIKSRSSFGNSNSDWLDESYWLVDSSCCPLLNFSMEENLQECPTDLAWPCEIEKQRSFCYLMYTSGSTGKPKGVCGTEEGLSNRFFWMQGIYPLDGPDLLLFKSSISFVDHLQEFLSAILTASVLVIPPFCELKDNVYSLIDFLQRATHSEKFKAYFINRLTAVPSLMRTILPVLQAHVDMRVRSSLKLLVLSGENFPLTLWEMLSTLLPKTSILNLYGSTEVSGDCTYFDCKRMPMILKTEILTSVPIGLPISNCDVLLLGENDASNEGELYVGGSCISRGYYTLSNLMSDQFVKLPRSYGCGGRVDTCQSQLYFRTGDLAKKLPSGDFVFLGRKDRMIKVNGQRVALEEIENLLREHPDINDAAVICQNNEGELLHLEAFIILKDMERLGELLTPSIRSWMINNLPSVMVPNRFIFTESFPMTSSGKVNYELLAGSTLFTKHAQDKVGNLGCSNLLQLVKKELKIRVEFSDAYFTDNARNLYTRSSSPYKNEEIALLLHEQEFCDALMVEEVSNDEDFFQMGGNSLAAAHVAHNLGIDMRFLYYFPSPFKLCIALIQKRGSCPMHNNLDSCSKLNVDRQSNSFSSYLSENANLLEPRQISKYDGSSSSPLKRLRRDLTTDITSGGDKYIPWCSSLMSLSCSFSRCNKVLCKGKLGEIDTHQTTWSEKIPRSRRGHMKDYWKIYTESCVDASPMLWEIKLEGRIECSAAIVSDFSQVVVGCYRGKIYFLDFSNGNICWSFQTSGEVKSQPVVDRSRQLIWCGSHDHNLYALDYKNHCCVYKLPCGGSIYGSPAIDEVCSALYVASTSGRLTALSIGDFPFNILWFHELEVPVFGSLGVTQNGIVICCLVDGHVLALKPDGSILWKRTTNGPIFAGACISSALPSQVLVCSRNGSVYSIELEHGDQVWEYNVGDPITASAYVDEHLKLESDTSHYSDRLVCICSSSGGIYVLRVNLNVSEDANQRRASVEEFGRLNLPGDIFSSPVMIGGRIFVGCRDDCLHCIALEIAS